MVTPIITVFTTKLRGHVNKGAVQPPNKTIRLGPIGTGFGLMNLKQLTKLLHQFRSELWCLVRVKDPLQNQMQEKLSDEGISNCRFWVIFQGHCLGPFGEIITAHQHYFVAMISCFQETKDIKSYPFHRRSNRFLMKGHVLQTLSEILSLTAITILTPALDISLHARPPKPLLCTRYSFCDP